MQFTVTFSESVTGVGTADFAAVATGVSGAAVNTVTGSGTTYTVTISTGTGSGTVGLNLVDDDSIIDAVGNPLGGAGAGNGNFTGEIYTVNRAPATHVVISQVYGGGGNAGATFKNDFIELFNPTGGTVDLTGWSVQYSQRHGLVMAGHEPERIDRSGPLLPRAGSGRCRRHHQSSGTRGDWDDGDGRGRRQGCPRQSIGRAQRLLPHRHHHHRLRRLRHDSELL